MLNAERTGLAGYRYVVDSEEYAWGADDVVQVRNVQHGAESG